MLKSSSLVVGRLVGSQDESPAARYQERGGVVKATNIRLRKYSELAACSRLWVIAKDICGRYVTFLF